MPRTGWEPSYVVSSSLLQLIPRAHGGGYEAWKLTRSAVVDTSRAGGRGFGITLTDAVNIFLRKSIMEGGLPFEMREPKPNATLRAAMQETEDILAGRVQTKHYANARALFDDLDAGDEEC